MRPFQIAALAAFALISLPLEAEEAPAPTILAEAGDLIIADGAAWAVGAMARTGAGYFTVTNTGAADDRLLAAASDAARRVELHIHELTDGVARMVELADGIAVPAGETVALVQGGHHVMFMGLTEGWDPEGSVAVTLVFERAGAVEVALPVVPVGRAGHGHGHGP